MAIHSAHRRQHREPFPAPPNPVVYRNIAYTFVAFTVIIVFAALWFSSVRATVTVTASRTPVMVEASVDVARSPGEGQLAGRVVQVVSQQTQEFTVGKSVSATSVDTVTTGRVRITNNYSKPQPLIKTTRLLTADGRLFRIDATVTVPSNGSVEVEAYSDKPGPASVLKSGVDFTIPGLAESLQKWITAKSITPFEGGTRTVSVLSQTDLDNARQVLEQAALEQAKKTLAAEVGDARFSDAAFFMKTVDQKSNIQVGEEADRFLMSIKLDVTGVFYSKSDMDSLVRQRIGERIPDGRGIVSVEGGKTLYTVNRADAKTEIASITVKSEVQTKMSEETAGTSKELIVGLPIDEAEQKLESVDGIESATITVRPSWVRRLPTLKDHITFKVE